MNIQVKLTKGRNFLTAGEHECGYDVLAKGIRVVRSDKTLSEEKLLLEKESFIVESGQTVLITTGIHIKLPEVVVLDGGNLRMVEVTNSYNKYIDTSKCV